MRRRRGLPGAIAFFFCVAIATAASAEAPGQKPFIHILGITQDAGYPQALCLKRHCEKGWKIKSARRTAVSLAVVNPSTKSTLLFEATPNLPDQLYRLSQVAPPQSFSMKGVFLTHAHMGHYTGLMHFGFEAASTKDLPVYAMPRMADYLKTNGPWSQLVNFGNIKLMALEKERPVSPDGSIKVTPFLVPHRDEYSETVGFRIEGPEKSALFIPDIDKWSKWDRDINELIRTVDYAFLDATFFSGAELPGRDMSKIMHPSAQESMARFEDLAPEDRAKVYFIHFNHTNPLLDLESEAAKTVHSGGFKVSYEGLELPL